MLLARLWYLICTFSFSCHFGGKCALLILSEFYCSWVFYSQNKNKLERRMKWERIGVSTALTLGRTENVTIAVSFTNSLLQLATINGKNSSECPSDSCRVITVQSSNSILTKSDTQQSVTLMCLRFRNGNENIFFNDRGCFPESKRKDEKHGEIRVWYAQSWGCWLFMLWTIECYIWALKALSYYKHHQDIQALSTQRSHGHTWLHWGRKTDSRVMDWPPRTAELNIIEADYGCFSSLDLILSPTSFEFSTVEHAASSFISMFLEQWPLKAD